MTTPDKIRIYISLPVSGRDMIQVRAESDEVSEALRILGLEPVSPLDITPIGKGEWVDYLIPDLLALKDCDGMVRVDPEHHDTISYGCETEYSFARGCSIPIVRYEMARHKFFCIETFLYKLKLKDRQNERS